MLLTYLDYIGIYFFTISGCLVAAEKRMDYFGILIIGMITAIGGGTARDLILGDTPVYWISNYGAIFTVLLGAITTVFAYKILARLSKMIFIFDTLGIATCTVIGAQKALDFGSLWYVASLFGVMTAVFGGLIRDVVCNRIPLVLRKEVYATACLAGAMLYCFLHWYLGEDYRELNIISSMLVIVTIRVLSVVFKWRIPVITLR